MDSFYCVFAILSIYTDIEVMNHFLKKNPMIFWYVNLFFPLICGITLYIFIRQDWWLIWAENHSAAFHRLRTITYREFVPKSWLGLLAKNQLGDLLWAYALEIALVLSTGNLRKAFCYGVGLTIAAECFQMFPFVYATFDVIDIIAQLIGVAIAHLVSRTFYKYWLAIETS